jgi:hypothetical protein
MSPRNSGPDVPLALGSLSVASYDSQGYGGGILSASTRDKFVPLKLKLIYDRQSVGQSVWVPGSHLGRMTRFLLSLWRLRVSWSPSLTRRCVCNLLVRLLISFARAVTLGSKSLRTHGLILLSYLRFPQPGGPGPRIYMDMALLSIKCSYHSNGVFHVVVSRRGTFPSTISFYDAPPFLRNKVVRTGGRTEWLWAVIYTRRLL